MPKIDKSIQTLGDIMTVQSGQADKQLEVLEAQAVEQQEASMAIIDWDGGSTTVMAV